MMPAFVNVAAHPWTIMMLSIDYAGGFFLLVRI
ncbi:Uncharacterised protein [Serratia marcescens]|nr:Uncharacterised protein [Serratia marcescens]SUJ35190.1 Uncharacterised protein [Serratia marcescens]